MTTIPLTLKQLLVLARAMELYRDNHLPDGDETMRT